MVKKAKIDLLDVSASEENKASFQDDRDLDGGNDEARDDHKPAWISRLGGGRSKILLILAVSILVLVIAGGSVWFYVGKEKKEPVSTQKDVRKTVVPDSGSVVLFDHFVVDVRDKKGDIRIAFCDVAVELEHPRAKGAAGEQVELRNVIYAVLKKKSIVEGLSPEGRELIKVELKKELNRLLGEKAVKNIYITRFEVI